MSSRAEDDYLLGTDYEELRRLQMQHWTWQPETVDLWDHAGFHQGQTILDVGCGPGLTTLELAERVGPEGRGVGIDGSEEFTDILRRKAEGIGHIEVVQADVRALDLPADSADAALRAGCSIFSQNRSLRSRAWSAPSSPVESWW